MIYKQIKKYIERDSFDKDDLLMKIDNFYLFNRITTEEYNELMKMLGVNKHETNE